MFVLQLAYICTMWSVSPESCLLLKFSDLQMKRLAFLKTISKLNFSLQKQHLNFTLEKLIFSFVNLKISKVNTILAKQITLCIYRLTVEQTSSFNVCSNEVLWQLVAVIKVSCSKIDSANVQYFYKILNKYINFWWFDRLFIAWGFVV